MQLAQLLQDMQVRRKHNDIAMNLNLKYHINDINNIHVISGKGG